MLILHIIIFEKVCRLDTNVKEESIPRANFFSSRYKIRNEHFALSVVFFFSGGGGETLLAGFLLQRGALLYALLITMYECKILSLCS